jgi:hypothetical protein
MGSECRSRRLTGEASARGEIPTTYTFPEAKVGLLETLCAIQIPHVQVKVVEIHFPSRLSAICHLLPPVECFSANCPKSGACPFDMAPGSENRQRI